MRIVQVILNGLFDTVLAPLRTLSPWPGLLAVALLTSVVVLLIFRVASNPATVRRKRDRLLARVLELVLFKDDLVVNLSAFGRVLVANVQYIGTLLVPLALSIVPVMLILVQSYVWFGLRPLQPGETTLLTARFSADTPLLQQEIALATSAGLHVDSPPVRAISRHELSWRIRVDADGSAWAAVTNDGQEYRKSIGVGRTLAAVSAERNSGGFWSALAWSREPPLPADSSLQQLAVTYPVRELRVFGWNVNWLLAFFVLTMVFGFALKKPLGVEL